MIMTHHQRSQTNSQPSEKHTRVCVPWGICVWIDGRLTLQPCQITELRRDENQCRALVHEVTWSDPFLILWSTNGNITSIKPKTRGSVRQSVWIEAVVGKERYFGNWEIKQWKVATFFGDVAISNTNPASS